jgi:predicted phosphohydrolase
MKILMLGDVHAHWTLLNDLIAKKKPDIILQCGDYGYWKNLQGKLVKFNGQVIRYNLHGVDTKNTKIYFCDGNHEDHWSLRKIRKTEISPNIFYMKRGSTLQLPDGRTVLFIGGANSIDKNVRTTGLDWFPEEVISQRDVINLPDVNVDIVVSHTCPEEFLPYVMSNHYTNDNDCSRKALSYVLEKYRPSLWYFGHWHWYRTGYNSRCKWTALGQAGSNGWWKWLKEK